jgi:hypothetical protein
MSTPSDSDDVKLICSLFSREAGLIDRVIPEMEEEFGPVDARSSRLMFDRTRYYEKEMGWPLHRIFLTFRDLIRPEDLPEKKLATNRIEKAHSCDEKRIINIDPGYISLERLVLATGKNYIHRIYLSRGIYADLTLVFNRGTFKALEWSYPDYCDPEVIAFFNEQREKYKNRIRNTEEKKID